MNNQYEDKELVCKDCLNKFTFTAGEQKFFNDRGIETQGQPLFPPKRCKPCRKKKSLEMNQYKYKNLPKDFHDKS